MLSACRLFTLDGGEAICDAQGKAVVQHIVDVFLLRTGIGLLTRATCMHGTLHGLAGRMWTWLGNGDF